MADTLSGKPCENGDCMGHYRVDSSKRRKKHQVQYHNCGVCGDIPHDNKRIVPLDEVKRRKPRKRPTKTGLTKETDIGNPGVSGRISADVGDFTRNSKGETMQDDYNEEAPAFVDAWEAGRMLGLKDTETAFLRLTGQFPQPVEFPDGKFFYSVSGVLNWYESGCPVVNKAAYERFRQRRYEKAQAEAEAEDEAEVGL